MMVKGKEKVVPEGYHITILRGTVKTAARWENPDALADKYARNRK